MPGNATKCSVAQSHEKYKVFVLLWLPCCDMHVVSSDLTFCICCCDVMWSGAVQFSEMQLKDNRLHCTALWCDVCVYINDAVTGVDKEIRVKKGLSASTKRGELQSYAIQCKVLCQYAMRRTRCTSCSVMKCDVCAAVQCSLCDLSACIYRAKTEFMPTMPYHEMHCNTMLCRTEMQYSVTV